MNFILRTQVGENNFLNEIIGSNYTISKKFNKTTKEWEKEVKKYFPLKQDFTDVECIVIFNKAVIIYSTMKAWIMTESGSTFEKIT